MSEQHPEKAIKLNQVRQKRLVLFVGGFDPRGARHYHQLMRREAAKQSKVAGVHYKVGPRGAWLGEGNASTGTSRHSVWSVSAEHDGQQGTTAGVQGCTSDYVFVDWTDHVRQHWPKHSWQVWGEALRTYAVVLKERKLLKPLHQQTPFVLWTLFYPLVYALLTVLLAVGAIALLSNAVGWGAYAVGAAIVYGGYKLDQVLHVSWLLRILNFARRSAKQPMEQVHRRFVEMADAVAQEVTAGQYQEVVVVGFSVGSSLAVPLVQALRKRFKALSDSPQRLHLLTLGNCIPLFSLMPQSNEVLRQALLELAQDQDLHWIDISAPSDSVSFGMCNLMALSLPDASKADLKTCLNPRYMCSPRFHTLFSPPTYRWLRRNKMRMHFQYLMASELPGAYDYFALMTCPIGWMDFISKRLVR